MQMGKGIYRQIQNETANDTQKIQEKKSDSLI